MVLAGLYNLNPIFLESKQAFSVRPSVIEKNKYRSCDRAGGESIDCRHCQCTADLAQPPSRPPDLFHSTTMAVLWVSAGSICYCAYPWFVLCDNNKKDDSPFFGF